MVITSERSSAEENQAVVPTIRFLMQNEPNWNLQNRGDQNHYYWGVACLYDPS